MKRFIIFNVAVLVITNSYALTNFFCPAHSQYINLGDSQQKVLAACGNPGAKQTPQPGQVSSVNNQTQVWSYQPRMPVMQYHIYQSNDLANTQFNAKPPSLFLYYAANPYQNNTNGAFKVTINNNRITTITGHPNNIICNNWKPYTNVTTKELVEHCGQPTSIQNQGATQAPVNPYTAKVEQWSYPNPYGPGLQLQFTNGQLTQIDLQ